MCKVTVLAICFSIGGIVLSLSLACHIHEWPNQRECSSEANFPLINHAMNTSSAPGLTCAIVQLCELHPLSSWDRSGDQVHIVMTDLSFSVSCIITSVRSNVLIMATFMIYYEKLIIMHQSNICPSIQLSDSAKRAGKNVKALALDRLVVQPISIPDVLIAESRHAIYMTVALFLLDYLISVKHVAFQRSRSSSELRQSSQCRNPGQGTSMASRSRLRRT